MSLEAKGLKAKRLECLSEAVFWRALNGRMNVSFLCAAMHVWHGILVPGQAAQVTAFNVKRTEGRADESCKRIADIARSEPQNGRHRLEWK